MFIPQNFHIYNNKGHAIQLLSFEWAFCTFILNGLTNNIINYIKYCVTL